MSETENAVLYSLKDIPVNEADKAPVNQQANIRAPKPSRGGGGESASSLLAGILDDTAQDAQMEEQRLQEELRRKAQEEEENRRRQENLKLEEANRRIQEELQRQQFANQERASMIRAIEGPSAEELEAKARAEEESRRRAELEAKLAEADRARAQAEQRAAAAAREAEIREQQRLEALAAPVAPAPKSKTGLFIGLAAAAMVCIVGVVAVVMFVLPSQNQVAGQTYPKTTYKPTMVASSFMEQGFVAIPQKKAVEDTAEPDATAKRPRRGKAGAKPAKKKTTKKGGFKGLGKDPFGGGKIVF